MPITKKEDEYSYDNRQNDCDRAANDCPRNNAFTSSNPSGAKSGNDCCRQHTREKKETRFLYYRWCAKRSSTEYVYQLVDCEKTEKKSQGSENEMPARHLII